jgi:methyl-accepting chemotaxis protein
VKWFFKRRRYLILAFQYQLLAVNIVYFVSAFLVFAAILFVPVMLELNAPLSGEGASEAANQFLSLHARLWPAASILFVLLIVHSVLVSHRIAGPLYRFRSFFEAISGGNLCGRVTIRKHDYLHEDARAISAMMTSLRTRIATLKGRHEEVLEALNQLKSVAESGSTPDIHRCLTLLQLQAERFKMDIDQFKTGDRLSDNPEIPMFSVRGPGG